MRILHVLKDVNEVGNGVVNAAIDLACVQRRLGHVVGVASAGGGFEPFLSANEVEHYRLDTNPTPFFRGWRARLAGILHLAKSFTLLRSAIHGFAPNVVHCHLAGGLVLTRMLNVGRRFALVAHIHNVQERRSSLMRLADAVIAVSVAVSEEMIKLGIPKDKLFVVQNRFVGSPRRSEPPPPPTAALHQPAIVCVAGLNKRKNIDGLIEAFNLIASEFPAAHLYLVGDGFSRGEFEEQAANSKAALRIHFEGFRSDPRPYMRNAYVFVLPSHRDSSPIVLHEAREMGAAIIATAVDGIPESLDYGRAGLLVPADNLAALAAALRRLLSDPTERERWKLASQTDLSAQSVAVMGKEVLEVYAKVLRRGRSGSLESSDCRLR